MRMRYLSILLFVPLAYALAQTDGDVIINEDYNSESFGEIIRIYAEISVDNGNGKDIKPVVKVEKVKVGKSDKDAKDTVELDKALKKQIEDKVVALFGIDKENIVISQIERNQ